MSDQEFQLGFTRGVDYEERVKVEIKFRQNPNKEDYQSALDAIDTLSILASKYLPVKREPIIMKGETK